MSEVAQKKVDQAPAAEVKKANVIGQKLFSVILNAIAFVVLYFAVTSGSETFMWGALGFASLALIVLYMRN